MRNSYPRMAELHIGKSAFTAAGWEGSFYPAGMKPADYLTYYATKFDTVEVDSTFYRTPAASNWKSRRSTGVQNRPFSREISVT